MVLALLPLLAAAPSALHADGPCSRPLAEALHRERPTDPVVVGGPLEGDDDLDVMLFPGPGAWRLSVTDRAGAARLERSLLGTDCPVEAAAVVVDRFLAGIAWRAGEAPLEAAWEFDAGMSTPAWPEPVVRVDAGVPAQSKPATSEAMFGEPAIAVGPAVTPGMGHVASAAASLEISLRVDQRIRTSLWLGGGAPETLSVPFGPLNHPNRVLAQQDFAYLTVAPCWSRAPFEGCGGLAVGATGAYGSASGQTLYNVSDGAVVSPALAALGRLAYASRVGIDISLQILLGAPVSRPSFSIDSAPPVEYALPPVALVCALQAGWRF